MNTRAVRPERLDKRRTGASSINKYYGVSGPNYLRAFERVPRVQSAGQGG